MVFGECKSRTPKKAPLRPTFVIGLALVLALTVAAAKAETASAIGPVGAGETVTLADGTECRIFASVGKTYLKPEVGSLHSVRCDVPVVSLFVESTLRQTSGGGGFDSGFGVRFFSGFYSETLDVPATPGTYSATTRATIDGQTFEVTDSRTVEAGTL